MDQPPEVQPSLPSHTPVVASTPKKGWLVGGIVAGVLVVFGGLGWWFTASAQDTYVKAAAAYEENLKEAFLFYKDAEDTEDRVNTVKDKFNAALANRPQEPNMMGVPLPAPSATKDRVAAISMSFAALRDAFVDFHTFNGFADECLTLLDGLERDPLIDIHTNESAFNQAADTMRAIQGPAGVADFRRQKADALAAIAAQVGKAEAAIAAIDTAGYKAAQDDIKKLQPQVSVPTVVGELQGLYRPYYDGLSAAYNDVTETLGVEG